MSIQLTINAKNQVTFSKPLVEHLGLAIGDKIEVEKTADGGVIFRKSDLKSISSPA